MQGKIIVTWYEMADKHLGLRLALVSDLHNCEYHGLLDLLRTENPDAILAAGDILERLDENECEWTAEMMEKWQTTIGKRTLTDRVMWVVDRLVERNGVATQHGSDNGIEFLKVASSIAPLFTRLEITNGISPFLIIKCSLIIISRFSIMPTVPL